MERLHLFALDNSMTMAISLQTSVLIAQAVFLLEHGHTDTHIYKVSDAADHLYRRRG